MVETNYNGRSREVSQALGEEKEAIHYLKSGEEKKKNTREDIGKEKERQGDMVVEGGSAG